MKSLLISSIIVWIVRAKNDLGPQLEQAVEDDYGFETPLSFDLDAAYEKPSAPFTCTLAEDSEERRQTMMGGGPKLLPASICLKQLVILLKHGKYAGFCEAIPQVINQIKSEPRKVDMNIKPNAKFNGNMETYFQSMANLLKKGNIPMEFRKRVLACAMDFHVFRHSSMAANWALKTLTDELNCDWSNEDEPCSILASVMANLALSQKVIDVSDLSVSSETFRQETYYLKAVKSLPEAANEEPLADSDSVKKRIIMRILNEGDLDVLYVYLTSTKPKSNIYITMPMSDTFLGECAQPIFDGLMMLTEGYEKVTAWDPNKIASSGGKNLFLQQSSRSKGTGPSLLKLFSLYEGAIRAVLKDDPEPWAKFLTFTEMLSDRKRAVEVRKTVFNFYIHEQTALVRAITKAKDIVKANPVLSQFHLTGAFDAAQIKMDFELETFKSLLKTMDSVPKVEGIKNWLKESQLYKLENLDSNLMSAYRAIIENSKAIPPEPGQKASASPPAPLAKALMEWFLREMPSFTAQKQTTGMDYQKLPMFQRMFIDALVVNPPLDTKAFLWVLPILCDQGACQNILSEIFQDYRTRTVLNKAGGAELVAELDVIMRNFNAYLDAEVAALVAKAAKQLKQNEQQTKPGEKKAADNQEDEDKPQGILAGQKKKFKTSSAPQGGATLKSSSDAFPEDSAPYKQYIEYAQELNMNLPFEELIRLTETLPELRPIQSHLHAWIGKQLIRQYASTEKERQEDPTLLAHANKSLILSHLLIASLKIKSFWGVARILGTSDTTLRTTEGFKVLFLKIASVGQKKGYALNKCHDVMMSPLTADASSTKVLYAACQQNRCAIPPKILLAIDEQSPININGIGAGICPVPGNAPQSALEFLSAMDLASDSTIDGEVLESSLQGIGKFFISNYAIHPSELQPFLEKALNK